MRSKRAFTIIELLVVVSIIALLVAILLPAIGKAREQARLTQSQANLRNLAVANGTYATEWNDRQVTLIDDNIASYGSTPGTAFANYAGNGGCNNAGAATCHPPVILGWAAASSGSGSGLWGYWQDNPGNHVCCEPIRFTGSQSHFGSFRIVNARQFNQYVSGRFYDPVFYAPKDRIVQSALEPCLDDPGEFCPNNNEIVWSSYCWSPAAMFSPDVLSWNETENAHYTDPYSVDAGFRSPAVSQALYPTLKTHMLEHHWLQQTRAECNPNFTPGTFDGCEPYYFNAAYESAPVTLFFDGHIESLGCRQAVRADARAMQQSGVGLWSRTTPFGTNGYHHDAAYDWTDTSFHILTTFGIRGRDITK